MANTSKRFAVERLRALPRPISPAEGAAVDPGDGWRRPNPLVLVTGNSVAKATHYLFEIECENGEILASPPIPAADGKTQWTVPGLLRPGMKYVWRVRIMGGGLKSGVPVASSRFTVQASKGR